jgi:hypothetical protein
MKLDLEAKRGDTWYWEFTVQQPSGEVQDITGGTFRFTAKADIGDADGAAVVVGTTADGRCQVTDGPSGIVKVKIPASVTVDVAAPATLVWDLQARDSAGDVWTPFDGDLVVKPDVSITIP